MTDGLRGMTADQQTRLGSYIRTRRENLGKTQQDIANASDLSPSLIHRIEAGAARTTLKTVKRLSTTLGFDYEEALAFAGVKAERGHAADKIEQLQSHAPIINAYRKLTREVKSYLAVLTVFEQSFTLEAAENVLLYPANETHWIHRQVVDATLSVLVEMGFLVHINHVFGDRYQWIPDAYAFVASKLVDDEVGLVPADYDNAKRLHRNFYVKYIGQIYWQYRNFGLTIRSAKIHNPNSSEEFVQSHVINYIDIELGNIRKALETSLEIARCHSAYKGLGYFEERSSATERSQFPVTTSDREDICKRRESQICALFIVSKIWRYWRLRGGDVLRTGRKQVTECIEDFQELRQLPLGEPEARLNSKPISSFLMSSMDDRDKVRELLDPQVSHKLYNYYATAIAARGQIALSQSNISVARSDFDECTRLREAYVNQLAVSSDQASEDNLVHIKSKLRLAQAKMDSAVLLRQQGDSGAISELVANLAYKEACKVAVQATNKDEDGVLLMAIERSITTTRHQLSIAMFDLDKSENWTDVEKNLRECFEMRRMYPTHTLEWAEAQLGICMFALKVHQSQSTDIAANTLRSTYPKDSLLDWLTKCEAVYNDLNDSRGRATSLAYIGDYYLQHYTDSRFGTKVALASYRSCLIERYNYADVRGIAFSFDSIARLMVRLFKNNEYPPHSPKRQRHLEMICRLFGSADGIRNAGAGPLPYMGKILNESSRLYVEQNIATYRVLLDEASMLGTAYKRALDSFSAVDAATLRVRWLRAEDEPIKVSSDPISQMHRFVSEVLTVMWDEMFLEVGRSS